jgi:glutamine synthetase
MTSTTNDFDVFITDLNGCLRGKRLPANSEEKILTEGIKLPRSVISIDLWGEDVAESGLVFETGDNDGICLPISSELKNIPWKSNRKQMQTMMHEADGSPFMADPRQILKHVLDQYQQMGYTPVVATELEFYLVKQDDSGSPRPLNQDLDGYSLELLDQLDDFLNDIRTAATVMDIDADAIISEIGPGQFEINLNHQTNALLAADQAINFKCLIKGVAKKHGYTASFMAKPFAGRSGNGFHVHFSLLNMQQQNIFDNGTENGSSILLNAVAGLMKAMPESMLLFAPHLNSYKRLAPGTHAPTLNCWGYDNRTTAVRIPESSNQARRIEHRVAGADANPYLVIAAVLGAALYGIDEQLIPNQPISGNAYDNPDLEVLPDTWRQAIIKFENATLLPRYLGPLLVPVFTAIKKCESEKIAGLITDVEYQAYLNRL